MVALFGAGRILTSEPGVVTLVLGVIVYAINGYSEAETHNRVTYFQVTSTAILRCGRCQPGIDGVIDEGIVHPFLDFMAETVNILDIGECVAEILAEDARVAVGGKHVSVYLLLPIAVEGCCGTMVTKHAAVAGSCDVKEGIVDQEDWQYVRADM